MEEPNGHIVQEFLDMGEVISTRRNQVRRASDLRNGPESVVTKRFPRGQHDWQLFKKMAREVLTLLILLHDNVVRLKEVRLGAEYLWVIMEDCGEQTVQDLVNAHGGKLTEARGRRLFQKMVAAVDYLHRLGLLKRNLKLRDFVLHEVHGLKMCGFGCTKPENVPGNAWSLVRTNDDTSMEFFAPEMQNPPYGPPADVFLLGCLLAKMLGITITPLGVRQINPEEQENWDALSGPLKHLLHRLLELNPNQRITIAQIWQNAWFSVGLTQQDRNYNDQMTAAPLRQHFLNNLPQSEQQVHNMLLEARHLHGQNVQQNGPFNWNWIGIGT